MSAEIPRCEPTAFIAGDTVKWTRNLAPDYSYADGWRLKYAFRGVGEIDVTADADTDGIGFSVTIPATSTRDLDAGQYRWAARVELSGEVFTVATGVLTIAANVLEANEGDLRPSAEIELELVEAQIRELLASPNEQYSIGQRSVQKRKLEDLNRQRGILIAKLGRQRGQPYPTHAVRFHAAR